MENVAGSVSKSLERASRSYLPAEMRTLLTALHIDLESTRVRVSLIRSAAATVLAVIACLCADALIVAIGTRIFPSTAGYPHFQFSDYAKLTVIGIVFACAGWPVVTFISPSPTWLYLRLSILGTLVLYLPDLWILAHGQPLDAVVVLMCMHLAVIVIAYNVMVHLAPPWTDTA